MKALLIELLVHNACQPNAHNTVHYPRKALYTWNSDTSKLNQSLPMAPTSPYHGCSFLVQKQLDGQNNQRTETNFRGSKSAWTPNHQHSTKPTRRHNRQPISSNKKQRVLVYVSIHPSILSVWILQAEPRPLKANQRALNLDNPVCPCSIFIHFTFIPPSPNASCCCVGRLGVKTIFSRQKQMMRSAKAMQLVVL